MFILIFFLTFIVSFFNFLSFLEKIVVILRDGKNIVGVCRTFDHFGSIIFPLIPLFLTIFNLQLILLLRMRVKEFLLDLNMQISPLVCT